MSLLEVTRRSLSSSMIQPSSAWPDLTPSTTTTPTPSPSSCTTKWIMTLFYSNADPGKCAPPLPAFAGRAGSGSRIFANRFSIRSGRRVRLSHGDGGCALDAPRRRLLADSYVGDMGGGWRRLDEDDRAPRRNERRAGVGAFGP